MSDKPRVVLAGGSGFIGRALSRSLAADGYDVVVLTRSPATPAVNGGAGVTRVAWDGKALGDWAACVDGADAVVNLAGKNVNCRYTRKNLREIDESRVDAVTVMARAIGRAAKPPRVLVQASTTAIYGDAGERVCDEFAPPGDGVPPQTATKWESAFRANPTPQTRRVLLRISFALGRDGGALKTLATLTRWFLGGRVGTGRQYISWIHIDDLCRMVSWAIRRDDVEGLYNAATPHPVTNAEFMWSLRRALGRPWSPRTPAWAVHLGAFFMRTEPVLALTGRRVDPRRLLEQGFEFKFPQLDEALHDLFAAAPAAVATSGRR